MTWRIIARRATTFRRTVLVAILVLFPATFAYAAADVWDGNGANPPNGIWGTGANWVDNTTPGFGDTASFNLAPTYTVTFNAAPATIQALTVANGNVTFASSGGVRKFSLFGGTGLTVNGGATLNVGVSGNPMNLLPGDLVVGNGPNTAQLFVNFASQFGGIIDMGDVGLSTLNAGVSGDGSIVVDGAGSRLTTGDVPVNLGLNGHTGQLTYRNGAAGRLAFEVIFNQNSADVLHLGDSNVAGTSGVLNVESDADVTVGTVSLASIAGSVGSATMNIHGIGTTVTQPFASSLSGGISGGIVVGNSSTGTAAINIGVAQTGGALTASSGVIDINRTGTVTVGNGSNTGSLNAIVRVRGGSLIVNTGSSFTGTLQTISQGGFVHLAGDFNYSDLLDAGSSLEVEQTLDMTPRSSKFTPFIADGAGTSVTANIGTLHPPGVDSTLSTATFRHSAVGLFPGGVNLQTAVSGVSNYSTFFTIESDADVTTGPFTMTANADVGIVASITLNVTGPGTTLHLNPGAALSIGNVPDPFYPGSTSVVANVLDDGEMTVGIGGTTHLYTNGTLHIDGGVVDLATLDDQGGVINFTAGALNFLGNLTIGIAGPMGNNMTLSSDRRLTLSGTVTVDPSRTLALNGGTLTTGSLLVNGTFNFIAGTLEITQAGASINTPIVTGNPSTINVSANNVSLGSAASFDGFNHQGVLNVGANSVTLNSAGYARLGVLTSLAGGAINAPNGLNFASGANFLGHGAINARVVGELGTVIQADGPLSLGDAASPAGFNFAGELRTKEFAVTLNTSAAAGLGNLTTLGSGVAPGTLNASNGFVVDFDEAITGYGTINSANSLSKRATINGTVQGTSVAQPITLSGYIKGTGTFSNANFTGTYSPGLSPMTVAAGNLSFSSSSTLIMELGGATPGSEYDQLQSSGALAFGGTLQVSLINWFTPVNGQSFDLFDWASTSGAFTAFSLPTLGTGLVWNTSQLYTSGVLSVASAGVAGDYNNNGAVDAADYVLWRKHNNTPTTLPNDATAGTDDSDYNVWRADFGQTAGNGPGAMANAAVPEPATIVMLLFAAAVQGLRRRRGA